MKKVLSLVLVIAMVLSSMSFAFAAKFEDVTGDYTKAVDALSALGIVNGFEDGTFRPENSLKRGELAKLLVEALGYGNLVAGSASNFSDMKGHWADGHVAIAAGTGLVAGYPDGTFKPEKVVTYDEALTMVIRALGYTDASLKGTWPTNYKVKAIDLGLTKNVKMVKAEADRGGIAQVLFNALEKVLVTVDKENKVTNVKDADDDNVLLLSKVASLNKAFKVTPQTIDTEDKAYAGNKVDLTQYMYQSLQVYLNDDDEVVYVKKSNNLVIEGVLNAASDLTASSSNIVVENAKEDDYTCNIVTGSAFMVNGVEATQADAVYNGVNVSVKVVLDAASNDKLASGYNVLGVVAEKQTKVAQITDEYVAGKLRVDAFALPKDSNDKVDLKNIIVTGAANSLEDITKDDVVTEYKAVDNSKTKLVVSRDTVEGKVTRVDATGSVTKYYIGGKSYTVNALATVTTPVLGTEGTFFLDNNGKIAAFEGQSGPSEYAMVLGVANGKTQGKFGSVSIKDYPQIKLVTAKNEEVVYDVFVKLGSDKKMSDSVTVNTVKIFEASNDGNVVYADGTVIDAAAFTGLESANNLIKYSVNKDGKIDAIKVIGGGDTFADKDDSKLVFANNAVIFDGRLGQDFAVISKDRLQFPVTARDIAYNTDGQIEAMVTSNVKAGASKTYAYIDKANEAYNEDGDKVQLVVAYLNGAKVEYLTDGNYFGNTDAINAVYALDLDGEVITGKTAATTTTGILVDSISTVTNSVAKADGTRYFLNKDCTILKISGATGETEDIIDLYDIKGDNVTLYLNADNEVVFIVK